MFKHANVAREETERSQREEYIEEIIKVEKEINNSINNGIACIDFFWKAILPPTQMIGQLKELGYNVYWNKDSNHLQISWKE